MRRGYLEVMEWVRVRRMIDGGKLAIFDMCLGLCFGLLHISNPFVIPESFPSGLFE